MKTGQARLTLEELHELKWLMGGCVTLLSIWSLSGLELQNEGFIFLAALVVAAALLKPRLVARIPSVTWRFAGPVLLFAISVDFILSMPEFLGPLVRMVILLLVYRSLAPRTKREDLQVILLSLFCLVISGVLTVSLLFAFQILIFTPLAMALLFVICLLDRGPESVAHQTTWNRFTWGGLIRRVGQVTDFRVVSLGGTLFVFVVLVSSMLFILTPRFNLEQAIPFLQLPVPSRSGFSERVELGSVTSIQEDNSVALRVDVPSLDALSESPYWRMLVLDGYDEGSFTMSGSLQTDQFRRQLTDREVFGWGMGRSGPPERWTFYLEGGVSRYLPLPGSFDVLRFQGMQDFELVPEVYVAGLKSARQSVFFYQVEDLTFNRRFPASQLEVDYFSGRREVTDGIYPSTTLGLPLEEDELAVLDEINAALPATAKRDAASYSQAVTDYLRENFRYSLNPNGLGLPGDAIVGWLSQGNRGHCELFAGSFVLLARDAGFPARMVVGFSGGSWNSVEEYFVIRNREAHAWAEIFEASTGEWIRVDPTPGAGSSDPNVAVRGGMQFEAGWDAWIDSLRIQWYRRIVNFDQQDQVEMADTLMDSWKHWKERFAARFERLKETAADLLRQPFRLFNPAIAAGIISSAILILSMVHFRYWWLGLLHRLLRRPKALDPVRRQAGRFLRRMRDRQDLSKKDPAAEFIQVREELEALRFGPDTNGRDARTVFKTAKRILRKRDVA